MKAENRKLLDAFEYLDGKYIDELFDALDTPPKRCSQTNKKSHWKYLTLLAACLLLMAFASPVVNYVVEAVRSFAVGIGSGTEDETTEIESMKYDEYVLTEEDLEMMNAAYRNYVDLPETYKFFKSIEYAMQREKDNGYYFGKYGDTIILWSAARLDGLCCFEIGGYSFDFYTGTMFFFNDGVLYHQYEFAKKDILTSDEIKAFYEQYTDNYLPMARDPHICFEFTQGLELLSEDEMRNINKAYDTWKFDLMYSERINDYIKAAQYYDSWDPEKEAADFVRSIIGCDPHRFFHEDNLEEYRYYGKFGNKYVLWVTDGDYLLKTLEVAGCKFIFTTNVKDFVVYKDGEFIDFAEAYENGIITAEDVALVYERHLAYNAHFADGREETPPPDDLVLGTPLKPSPIALTEDEMREIVWEFISRSDNVEEEIKYDWAVRCYAASDSAYAVMLDLSGFYAQVIRTESVAGYTFTFPNSQKMYIYKDGAFYRLGEAYALGVVDEEFIGSILWENKTKS